MNLPVRELRLAVTVDDFDAAVAFYAGRATLELISVDQAELIDRVEVGSARCGTTRTRAF